MRRFRALVLLSSLVLLPGLAHAYIGAGLGVVDEDKFGYGLVFGAGLPGPLGLDFQLLGTNETAGGEDFYWVQGNVDLSWDFNKLWKSLVPGIDFHPYVKAGFTYGALLIDTPIVSEIQAAHGPGMNFGGGLDWKLLSFLTVGVDLTESITWLNGVSAGGFTLPDTTEKTFNFLVVAKLFAY